MSNHLMTDIVLGDGNTEQEVRRAIAVVAHYATDDAEARRFCQQLGFIPTIPAHPQARDDTGRMRRRRR